MSGSSSLSPLPEMPLLPITSAATVHACRAMPASWDTDIFIASYPKSGTTWLQNLVCRLLVASSQQSLPEDWHLSDSAPFYEVDQYWMISPNESDHKEETTDTTTPTAIRVPVTTPLQRLVSPLPSSAITTGDDFYRVFNTHLRPHQLPPQAKCLYVMRNPLDVLASFYYHLANMDAADGGYTGTPTEFCEEFLQGTVLYGKWQDHLEAWLSSDKVRGKGGPADDDDDGAETVLLLHYDEMKTDFKGQATRVAKFLGIPADQINAVVDAAIPHCTFEAMKQEQWRYTPRSVVWKKDRETGQIYQHFVRAGRIGDGKSFLETHGTQEMRQRWEADKMKARERWRKAGVDPDIIERYLQ